MSKYAYLKAITADPHQMTLDMALAARRNLQASALAGLTSRGWGDNGVAVGKTLARLEQLVAEALRFVTQEALGVLPERVVADYRRDFQEAGIQGTYDTIGEWLNARHPNLPSKKLPRETRPSDYYDREPVELFGLPFIELPPNCRVGSFTKAVTKAHASIREAVEELKARGLPQGDLLLKTLWDRRWQVFQRRQVTGRICTPMGSHAAKAPLGEGRLFIR